MKLVDKIKTLFVAGAILLPGCSFIQYLEPVRGVKTKEKLVEFYDVNMDGKIDRMNVSLAKPHREYVFDDIVKEAWTQYSAHDCDFNKTWDELRYYAQDISTKNITNCFFFDENDNGVYEKGILTVYIQKYEKAGQFIFEDIDENKTFDKCTFKGIKIRDINLLHDFDRISYKVQKWVKEDLKKAK